MLEVGNGKMSIDEYRTHMSLWAILAAPLLAGNDLSTMTPETLALLTNKEVIAVDQDALGKQGDRVTTEGPIEIWSRPLSGGALAVGIFNRHQKPLTAHVDFTRLGFPGNVHARDLWQHKDLDALPSMYNIEVPAHGVLMLRLTR
jgi:alpha-galactosidase